MCGVHNASLASGNTQRVSGKETDIFLDPDISSARMSLANLMAVLATGDTDEDNSECIRVQVQRCRAVDSKF